MTTSQSASAVGREVRQFKARPSSPRRCVRPMQRAWRELGRVSAALDDAEFLQVARQRLELAPVSRCAARGGQHLAGAAVADDDAPAPGLDQASQGAVVVGGLHVGELEEQGLERRRSTF